MIYFYIPGWSLLMAGVWNQTSLTVPSNPYHSLILCFYENALQHTNGLSGPLRCSLSAMQRSQMMQNKAC